MASLFLVFILVVGFFIFNIATSIWAYRDAKSRGKSSEFALIVLVATLIFPIVGLIVYYFIRHDL